MRKYQSSEGREMIHTSMSSSTGCPRFFENPFKTLLRLERGGEHVIWACGTKTVISWLIYKIS